MAAFKFLPGATTDYHFSNAFGGSTYIWPGPFRMANNLIVAPSCSAPAHYQDSYNKTECVTATSTVANCALYGENSHLCRVCNSGYLRDFYNLRAECLTDCGASSNHVQNNGYCQSSIFTTGGCNGETFLNTACCTADHCLICKLDRSGQC